MEHQINSHYEMTTKDIQDQDRDETKFCQILNEPLEISLSNNEINSLIVQSEPNTNQNDPICVSDQMEHGCIEWLVNDLIDEVVYSEYETPSVPDVIFETLNEI